MLQQHEAHWPVDSRNILESLRGVRAVLGGGGADRRLVLLQHCVLSQAWALSRVLSRDYCIEARRKLCSCFAMQARDGGVCRLGSRVRETSLCSVCSVSGFVVIFAAIMGLLL